MSNPRDERNPWQTRSSRMKYENAWIHVREDDVVRPDGTEGIYGVVEFQNRATGVIAVRSDGQIPLVGQWRYALDAYSWEIPEGGAPEGEEPLDAAKRELAEEAGVTAGRWEPLLTSHLSNCVSDEIAFIYLAQDLTIGEPDPDGDESLEVRWVSLSDAVEMVLTGEITDAVSQLGILTAAGRLGVKCSSGTG